MDHDDYMQERHDNGWHDDTPDTGCWKCVQYAELREQDIDETLATMMSEWDRHVAAGTFPDAATAELHRPSRSDAEAAQFTWAS